MNHPALITFVTSLTPPARRSAGEKWDLQQRPLHSHSRLQFIQNVEKLSNCGFYEILLTFHLISSPHSPPATVLHSQFPPPENAVRQITKQPPPPFLLRLCAIRSCWLNRLKTARGCTIITDPPISRPWPQQQQVDRRPWGSGSAARQRPEPPLTADLRVKLR